MNPYTVVWLPEVLDDLAAIWLQATDRNEVTTAQATIDRLLAQSPQTMGRLLSEDLRRINEPPLSATYTVDAASHSVEINCVWRIA